MKQHSFVLLLLCVVLLITSVPMTAQVTEQSGDSKPLVIIGREEERCHTLLAQLQSLAPANEYRAVPIIETEALDFELPKIVNSERTVFIFTSPRAVEYFVAKSSLPQGVKIMALGTGTQRALESSGYKCDLVSSVETTKGLAKEILGYFETAKLPITDFHFIQPTCDIAGNFIQKTLEGAGATFSRIETYRVTGHSSLGKELSGLAKEPLVVLFYSPSGVKSWVSVSQLRPVVVSIGPVTSKALKANGFTTIYESPTPHEEDLLATLLSTLSELSK